MQPSIRQLKVRSLPHKPKQPEPFELQWQTSQADSLPTGPGDSRPTAAAIVADEKLEGQLSNKVILITGCSSGIGVETARALHLTGADVYMTARDLKKGQEVIAGILASNTGPGRIELLELELDSLESVRQCASTFLSKSKKLDILICNAGTVGSQ